MSKRLKMGKEEAEEWFHWNIEGFVGLSPPEYAAFSTHHKICPHIGKRTADGRLTSILEVRRIVFRQAEVGQLTTGLAMMWTLSRSPELGRPLLNDPATNPFVTLATHPSVYESHLMSVSNVTNDIGSQKVHDYMEAGNTGLLIWNPNVYTHLTVRATTTETTKITWSWDLLCRVRMVDTEVYAMNNFNHHTVNERHNEDKPEEEHQADDLDTYYATGYGIDWPSFGFSPTPAPSG